MSTIFRSLVFITWPLVAVFAGLVFVVILILLWFFAMYGAFVGEKDAWRLLFPWK